MIKQNKSRRMPINLAKLTIKRIITLFYLEKEIHDLLMAVGSGRTCLAFRQRDFCHTHSKLVEANHLNEFTLIKQRIACQNFI